VLKQSSSLRFHQVTKFRDELDLLFQWYRLSPLLLLIAMLCASARVETRERKKTCEIGSPCETPTLISLTSTVHFFDSNTFETLLDRSRALFIDWTLLEQLPKALASSNPT